MKNILLAQLNPTIGDIAGNGKKILAAIQEGKAQGADLIVFPELAVTGYPPEDFLLMPHFLDAVEAFVEVLIPLTEDIAVIIGLPRRNPLPHQKPLFNSAAIIEDGKLLGYQDKILLPTYDVFNERRYFEPGDKPHKLWKIGKKNVAVTICEDIWRHSGLLEATQHLRDPVAEFAELKPDLTINLSASPFHLDKLQERVAICEKAEKKLQTPLLLCNQVGGNDSLIFDGNSLYFNKDGELVAAAPAFKESLFPVDLDDHCPQEPAPYHSMKQLHDALILGLRDYCKKTGFTRACLGLSGGVDSALVAYLAVEALGKDNLLAITLPSRYTSDASVEDAAALITTLGITEINIPIESPYQATLDLLEPHFQGKAPDTTEENLQARIRGMLIMSISNKFGHLVLSTGNKSEMAMGYSTLYGDMCGGLGVINDVTKEQVYALCRWINRDRVIIPENILTKAPSAELRPNQKDSDSLPEYAIVDAILQAYIEEHLPPQEIADRYGYPLELVEQLIHRIHLNEYKRRQAPPGLRISSKAFSVGRRFPIAQRWN